MPQYTISNQNAGSEQSLTSSYKTILAVTAATGATTLRRGWLTEFQVGADAALSTTDGNVSYSIDVQTAAGTSSSLTPQVNDIGGGDAAALLVYSANFSAEGTITANSNLWYMALNQRQSWRVQFRDEWRSIIVPAVNLKGFACRAKSPVASSYSGTVGWSGIVAE